MVSSIQGRLLIVCLAVVLFHIDNVKAQCYFPGGAWAKDQFPCDKYAFTALCCPTGWTCFSNNLCIATDPSVVSSDLPLGTAIRGTCTNPLWNNSVCGDFCLNDPVSSNNGSVIPCGDNNWCCEPNSADGICNCDTGKGTFQLSDGTAQTIIGVVGLQHTMTGSKVASSSVIPNSSAPSLLASPTSSIITSIPSSSNSSIMSLSSFGSNSYSSSISRPSISRPTSTISLTSTSNTGLSSTASPTGQRVLDTYTPATQTVAFKAGVGAAAVVVFAILMGLSIWLLIRCWRRRRVGGSEFGDGFSENKFALNPMTNDNPFQVAPNPHPYGDSQFSTSQSRAVLAEQISRNRRTPRPTDMINGNNPYADHYMAGGAGR